MTVDLTLFESGVGARFIGSPNSGTSRDVAIIGDHNGDGFEDYIVASPLLDSVAVIVMKKNTAYSEVSVASVSSGQYFRVIKGPSGSTCGSSLSGIGDINGDSFDDVIIGCATGAVSGRGNAGYAVVIFGKAGPFSDVMVTSNWNDHTTGFQIIGIYANGRFANGARSTRGLGDVNGDGIDDFAVSSSSYGTYEKNSIGLVSIIFGKTSAFSAVDTNPDNFGSNGIYFTGEFEYSDFGLTVMPAGDFNGDGLADFLIGSPGANADGRSSAGVVYLLFGSNTSLVTTDMSTFVTGASCVRFLGAAAMQSLGLGVSGVGDVNGDGIDDIDTCAFRHSNPRSNTCPQQLANCQAHCTRAKRFRVSCRR